MVHDNICSARPTPSNICIKLCSKSNHGTVMIDDAAQHSHSEAVVVRTHSQWYERATLSYHYGAAFDKGRLQPLSGDTAMQTIINTSNSWALGNNDAPGTTRHSTDGECFSAASEREAFYCAQQEFFSNTFAQNPSTRASHCSVATIMPFTTDTGYVRQSPCNPQPSQQSPNAWNESLTAQIRLGMQNDCPSFCPFMQRCALWQGQFTVTCCGRQL